MDTARDLVNKKDPKSGTHFPSEKGKCSRSPEQGGRGEGAKRKGKVEEERGEHEETGSMGKNKVE